MGKNYSGGVVQFTLLDASTIAIPAAISAPANAVVQGDDEGELYDRSLSLVGFAPVYTFTVKNIAAALDVIAVIGQCVGTGLAITGVSMYYRRLTDCQTVLSGTPHIKDVVSTGLLVLSGQQASRGGVASLTFTLYAISDGTNPPVVRTDGVALPATILTAQYTLGAFSAAGIEYAEVDSVSEAYNIGVDVDPALGLIWPTNVAVRTIRPVRTFTGRDLSKVTNGLLAAGFDNPVHADTKFQLIKLVNAGSFDSFGSSVHILQTMAGMLVPEDIVSIAANQRATHSCRIIGSFDGTNSPIIIDTTNVYDTTPAS